MLIPSISKSEISSAKTEDENNKTKMMGIFFISNINITFARSQKFKNCQKVDQKSKSLQKVYGKVLYSMLL